ncbi:MAG TPA: HflC protein [Lachnospiraceae bacterium]|nr:HflC protein [Lachnospiraceae bacterium]
MKKKAAAIVIVLIVLLAIGTSGICIVPNSHTGIVKRFGAVQNYYFNEGLHIVIPFITSVENIDNHILRTDVDGSSASKDLQTVTTNISINYDVPAASSIEVYKKVGNDIENTILRPAVQESVKSVISKYTAEELITKRAAVSDDIHQTLSETVKSYGVNIDKVNIINFDFSQEFNAAIEAKQTAQQQALKAEQDLARVKIEAEQQIAKAKAEAESYKLKNAEITDANIKMAWIEKWNGELPKTMTGGDSMIMIEDTTK